MQFEKFSKIIALLKDARTIAARLLFSGNARVNPQIILLAGILDRAQALIASMRVDFIEMAIPKTPAAGNDSAPAQIRFPRRSNAAARSDVIPFDRRRRIRDRRQLHTYIADDRRSGIADRRRSGQRQNAAR
jgi:hypothetical protein